MTYKIIGVGTNAKTVKGDGSEFVTAITYHKPYKTAIDGIERNLCAMAGVHNAPRLVCLRPVAVK